MPTCASDAGHDSASGSHSTLIETNHLPVGVRFTVAVLGSPFSGRCITSLRCPSLERMRLPLPLSPSCTSKLLWYGLQVRLVERKRERKPRLQLRLLFFARG